MLENMSHLVVLGNNQIKIRTVTDQQTLRAGQIMISAGRLAHPEQTIKWCSLRLSKDKFDKQSRFTLQIFVKEAKLVKITYPRSQKVPTMSHRHIDLRRPQADHQISLVCSIACQGSHQTCKLAQDPQHAFSIRWRALRTRAQLKTASEARYPSAWRIHWAIRGRSRIRSSETEQGFPEVFAFSCQPSLGGLQKHSQRGESVVHEARSAGLNRVPATRGRR